MKKILSFVIAALLLSSCIPYSFAPNIKEDKIKIAKRFKGGLPKQYALIFKDPKDADEFYYFINTKYDLNNESVEDNVPFVIDKKEFYLSFYEAERSTRTLNLLPIFIDAAIDEDVDPLFEDVYTSRKGHWYIALLVTDNKKNDCLTPNHKDRESVVKYLRALRKEYLNTNNYLEAMLKEKSKNEILSVD